VVRRVTCHGPAHDLFPPRDAGAHLPDRDHNPQQLRPVGKDPFHRDTAGLARLMPCRLRLDR
jgi:hypothetical protein